MNANLNSARVFNVRFCQVLSGFVALRPEVFEVMSKTGHIFF